MVDTNMSDEKVRDDAGRNSGGRPRKDPHKLRDARVQSFLTKLQYIQIEAIARMFGVDRVGICREAVHNFLDSEPTSLKELGRLRAEMLANVTPTVKALELAYLPRTKKVNFYLTQAERNRLDERAKHESLSRSRTVDRALTVYITKQCIQYSDLLYYDEDVHRLLCEYEAEVPEE